MQLVPRYQSLLHGAELVESQLKESLPEYLNAEIALKTVTDVSVAIAWLKGSFFYVRVRFIFLSLWRVVKHDLPFNMCSDHHASSQFLSGPLPAACCDCCLQQINSTMLVQPVQSQTCACSRYSHQCCKSLHSSRRLNDHRCTCDCRLGGSQQLMVYQAPGSQRVLLRRFSKISLYCPMSKSWQSMAW